MARPKAPAKVFKAAAAAIEKHGHCRGLLKSFDNDSMCLMGAISLVMHGDPLKPTEDVRRMADLLMPLTGINPIAWNNRPERTKEQVVSLLRKAAETA